MDHSIPHQVGSVVLEWHIVDEQFGSSLDIDNGLHLESSPLVVVKPFDIWSKTVIEHICDWDQTTGNSICKRHREISGLSSNPVSFEVIKLKCLEIFDVLQSVLKVLLDSFVRLFDVIYQQTSFEEINLGITEVQRTLLEIRWKSVKQWLPSLLFLGFDAL